MRVTKLSNRPDRGRVKDANTVIIDEKRRRKGIERCPVEIVISEYCNEATDIPINSLNRNACAVTFAIRLNETRRTR